MTDSTLTLEQRTLNTRLFKNASNYLKLGNKLDDYIETYGNRITDDSVPLRGAYANKPETYKRVVKNFTFILHHLLETDEFKVNQ